MLEYIRSKHVQDNNQCELLRARQIVNACDQCVKLSTSQTTPHHVFMNYIHQVKDFDKVKVKV